MKKSIYLSGPISGLDHEVAKRRFAEAEILYGPFNYETPDPKVYNPMEDPVNIAWKATFDKGMCSEDKLWKECMRNCIGWLVRCDEVVMLEGWEYSEGATIEHDLAKELGMKITYHK